MIDVLFMSLASISIFLLHFEAKDAPLTLPFTHVGVITVILKLLTKVVRKDMNEQAFQEFNR